MSKQVNPPLARRVLRPALTPAITAEYKALCDARADSSVSSLAQRCRSALSRLCEAGAYDHYVAAALEASANHGHPAISYLERVLRDLEDELVLVTEEKQREKAFRTRMFEENAAVIFEASERQTFVESGIAGLKAKIAGAPAERAKQTELWERLIKEGAELPPGGIQPNDATVARWKAELSELEPQLPLLRDFAAEQTPFCNPAKLRDLHPPLVSMSQYADAKECPA